MAIIAARGSSECDAYVQFQGMLRCQPPTERWPKDGNPFAGATPLTFD